MQGHVYSDEDLFQGFVCISMSYEWFQDVWHPKVHDTHTIFQDFLLRKINFRDEHHFCVLQSVNEISRSKKLMLLMLNHVTSCSHDIKITTNKHLMSPTTSYNNCGTFNDEEQSMLLS